MLVREKVAQAVGILKEQAVDCWITFVRESSLNRDPMLPFLSDCDVTWHSAFIVARTGKTYAIVGQLERQSIEDLGVYDRIFSYVEGIRASLLEVLEEISPASIALNFSRTSEIADGLTHGMYLTLMDLLSERGLQGRVVSAEKIVSALRARKTDDELFRIRKAIEVTEEIFQSVAGFIRAGVTEVEIARFVTSELDRRGVEPAWESGHCPAVFTGPDTAGAHYRPTDRPVRHGHVLNMDFGVRYQGYCSDLQRTFFIREPGAVEIPPEVTRGFQTIVRAIEAARLVLRPGVQGYSVDAAARGLIVAEGYEAFPHALGHQVGRFAHDGTALLGPAWEKYSSKPFEPIERGMVFTLEPRLTVPGRGIATVEEMVVVTEDGAEYLSTPQKELIVVGA